MEHTPPNLARARAVVEVLEAAVDKAAAHLASQQPEENQTVAYDLASISSAVAAAAELLGYGAEGPAEADLALLYAADVAADLAGRPRARARGWGGGGGGGGGPPPPPGAASPFRRAATGPLHFPRVRRGPGPSGGGPDSP
jgi:hypothetical protein